MPTPYSVATATIIVVSTMRPLLKNIFELGLQHPVVYKSFGGESLGDGPMTKSWFRNTLAIAGDVGKRVRKKVSGKGIVQLAGFHDFEHAKMCMNIVVGLHCRTIDTIDTISFI